MNDPSPPKQDGQPQIAGVPAAPQETPGLPRGYPGRYPGVYHGGYPGNTGYPGYPAYPGAPGSHQPSEPSDFSVGEAMLVLRRWGWKCLFAGLLLASAAAAIVWLTFVPSYEATAYLEIKARPIVIAFEQQDSQSFSATQLEMIRSPVILSRVASQPEVAGAIEPGADSVSSWLKKNLKASYRGPSELCEISFTAASPDVAALVANSVSDAYLSLHNTNVSEGAKRVVELLKEEKVRRAEEVRGFQQRVRTLTKSATDDDPSVVHRQEHLVMQQNPVAALEDRRTAAEVERAVLEAQLKALEETDGHSAVVVPPGDIEAAVAEHQDVKAIKLQLLMLQARLREHRRRSRNPDDADMRRMEKDVHELEQLIRTAAQDLRPQIEADLKIRLAAGRSQRVAELKTNIENQRTLEQIWHERIDEQHRKLDRMGDKSVDLDFARAELERAQDVFQRISDRIVMLQTEMGAPSRATPLKRADPPERPLEIIPIKRLLIACLAAFGLPFGLAMGWERWTRRIHDAQQLAQEANVPVLGEISTMPRRRLSDGNRGDARYLRDQLTFEESVDALRLALMLTPEVREMRSLAITSAVTREGKSSLASSLAASLAKCVREPILLIDADMRCPSLHEAFNTPLAPGLADVLGGERRIPETIIATAGGAVHFVPAGSMKTNPHGLLQRGDFSALIGDLKAAYRYIIIDTPPVLAASEALLIASIAEGTLVSTMRDRSRGPQFRMACHRLAGAGATLVGTVINGLPVRTWAYKYGGYGYGYQRYLDYSDPSKNGAADVADGDSPATDSES